MEPWTTAAALLEAFGPYSILVFLGWAYWKKDRQLGDMTSRVLALTEQQTAAAVKMEAALTSLRDVIRALSNRL